MPTDHDQQHAPRADHRSHAAMNFRLTAVLFGLVFLVGIVLLVQSCGDTTGSKEDAGTLIPKALAGVKAEEVAEVEVEKPDGAKLVLKRSGKDNWVVAAPVSARAEKSAVDGVVAAVLGLRAVFYGELQDNPSVHGLDAPLKVTLKTEDGKSETFKVGDVTVGGTKAVGFVSTDARPRPMAVSKASLDALLKTTTQGFGHAKDLAKWTTDYRTKTVFSATAGGDDVTALKLTRNNKDLALARGKTTGWEFAAPAGWGDAAASPDPSAAPGTLTAVRPIVSGLVGLAAGAPDDFLDAPADLTQYGLNPGNPDRVRVELKTTDGKTEVAFIGKKVDADKKDEKKDAFAPPGKVYVQLEGTPGVIRATASGLDGLAAVIDNPTPLRDRDLVRDDQKARIDAIDVTSGGQTVALRKSGTEWKLAGGPNDPQTANQTTANALLNLVTQPRIVKDFPAPNDANFAGAEMRAEVKLYADALETGTDPKVGPKVKADAKPTVLLFGKKDAAGVHVRRVRPDGSKMDFVVPDKVKVGTDPTETDVAAAVTKGRFDYLDPTLPTFSQFQANKLQLTQGANVTLEVTKEKAAAGSADPGWKYVKPDPMKGQTADAGTVGDLLNLLANQSAGKFVREIAEGEKAREKEIYLPYGLQAENPRLKVVVGLDAPAPGNERVYYLGNETEDKQSVYARVEGRAVVFTVPKFVYDRFAGADLRDRTLVRFDPAKLVGIRIRGWREATGGEMLIRQFRKEGGTWVAVQPPGFSLDPGKVNEFVAAVQGLRVKDFRTGDPHPDHRFLPEQSGFEITLDLDGADDIILNVAAEVDGGTARIAKVDTLSTPPRSQLVTVIPDALRAFRDSAKSFAR